VSFSADNSRIGWGKEAEFMGTQIREIVTARACDESFNEAEKAA
jgi:hypothetical protein